ncbi:hypothetical protein SAMN04487894_101456 [Niabella drilacis]|uniref:Uncharacterized protein n=1 Tax=Niabella drilacis (strain DSM 25811 / CCM 8410 / CCUG 62505 / LMG 26954 / E90) TaxID=1285928 RepID=A0A1G6J848_NIADE|nr:hypothetical protein SAMN04487894_101456 [Niabella drilacis]
MQFKDNNYFYKLSFGLPGYTHLNWGKRAHREHFQALQEPRVYARD